MIVEELKVLVSKGDLKNTIQHLLMMVNSYYTRFAPEVLLISSRFNQVNKEKNMGVLPQSDYNIEINSITSSLINIIDSIEGLSEENFKKKKPKDEVNHQIRELEKRYDQSRKKAKTIRSNPSRLREKNDIARELGEIFINHSDNIKDYFGTSSEGIIVGIANKYKRVPDVEGIDFFETVVENVSGNFTKCCIVNALAEIIYTGQILIGDDVRIYDLLQKLHPDSEKTVIQNISRVHTELDYFLGKVIDSKPEESAQ